jgi:hypothetical protein
LPSCSCPVALQLRSYAARRLATTVEEDVGDRAMHAQVRERLERATGEQVSARAGSPAWPSRAAEPSCRAELPSAIH